MDIASNGSECKSAFSRSQSELNDKQMIFGFNTDVVCGSTCYHLQSEFRPRERLLQTQVFVSGRCLGKVANPAPDDRSDEQSQEDLREQHRAAVTAAREGRIEPWLIAAGRSETPFSGGALDVLVAPMHWSDGGLHVKLTIEKASLPVAGASITVKVEPGDQMAESVTDVGGMADLIFKMAEEKVSGCTLQITVRHADHLVTRRFRPCPAQ